MELTLWIWILLIIFISSKIIIWLTFKFLIRKNVVTSHNLKWDFNKKSNSEIGSQLVVVRRIGGNNFLRKLAPYHMAHMIWLISVRELML